MVSKWEFQLHPLHFVRERLGSDLCITKPIYFFDCGPRGLALPCCALSVVQDHAQSYLHALKITSRTIEMKRAARTVSKS
jgi:hypothetical protein